MRSPVRHVALNALFLAPEVSGGPETYVRGLVPALAAEFPDTRFTLFTTREGARALHDDGWSDFLTLVALPADDGQRARRLAAEQLLLPAAARRRGAQMLHSLASLAPVALGMPSVVTVHDVTFFRIKTFGTATTIAMRAIVTTASRRANGLVTVSAAARDEIAAQLGIPPERFAVVHHGAGRPAATHPTPEAELRERYGIVSPRVVLCVGAKRPHKNQELLVRALPHLPPDVCVVCAGHPEPYEDVLRSTAADLGVADRLPLPGYVPDEDLEGLWRMARCVAFPTRAEGFGLPVVEAMARGLSVACSDLPVLREVGGGLAHYFDPHDPASAAQAIGSALVDDGGRGTEHARQFSWPAAARATFEVYERCTSA